jgi:hypothetical protein
LWGCKLTANFFTNPFQVQQLLQQEQQAHLLQRVLQHLPLQALLQAFPDLEKIQFLTNPKGLETKATLVTLRTL